MEQLALFNGNVSSAYCSIAVKDDKERVAIYNAMNNPDKQLMDVMGETLIIKDVLAEKVSITSKATGEIVDSVRVILIDVNNVTYSCVSSGVYNALVRIMSLFGAPTWDDGIKIKPKQIRKGERVIYTLELV